MDMIDAELARSDMGAYFKYRYRLSGTGTVSGFTELYRCKKKIMHCTTAVSGYPAHDAKFSTGIGIPY